MLPDFPEVRKYENAILEKWFHGRVSKRTGVLQEMGVRILHEGNKVELNRVDGSTEVISMKSTKSEFCLDLREFEEDGLGAVLKALDKTASDVAEKQTKYFFQRLNEVCEEAGQTSDAKGVPISFDLILEVFENVDVDFDKAGNPLLPSIISNPKVLEQLNRQGITDEQQNKFEQLIEAKRSEWRDRESNRKLVN